MMNLSRYLPTAALAALALLGTNAQPLLAQQGPFLQRLRKADENQDQKLDLKEFRAFVQDGGLGPQAGRPAVIFERLDQDQSGDLGLAELRRLAAMRQNAQAQPQGNDNQRPAQQAAAARFRNADKDNDGKLSQEEFAGLASQFPALSNAPDRREQIFQRLDADADGGLSPNELARLAQVAQQIPNRPDPRGTRQRENPFPRFVASLARRPGGDTPQATETEPQQPITEEQAAFFRERIEPVLADSCYRCHSSDSAQLRAGLLVDSKHGLLIGGDSGAAVVSGKPEESPLYLALLGEEYSLMPPQRELSAEVIEDFKTWIEMGAPDPRVDEFYEAPASEIDPEAARDHWAFQSPVKVTAPAAPDAEWNNNDIDRWVWNKLQEQEMAPVGLADRATLLRRVTFDLTGLPPTPEHLADFLADPNDTMTALATVVDRLLDSPQYGERWGRHWLDVARYAESTGKEFDILHPHAWRYRDYVVDAFNNDKPYDEFLREQLAGDLLPYDSPAEQEEHQIATGYLAIGPKSPRENDLRKLVLEIADEQIDAVGRGMLGVSIACARCHDHKFEPISQKDYYALAGIFASTETLYGGIQSPQVRNATDLLDLTETADEPDPAPLSPEALAQLKDQLAKVRADIRELGPNNRQSAPQRRQLTIQAEQLAGRIARYDEDGRSKRVAMGARDWQPSDLPLLLRGELDKPAEVVPRGFVSVLAHEDTPQSLSGSGRAELAEWIASEHNPLTARVMANRVWLHLFGRGIVASPDDFGSTGEAPSHPELLDTLAVDLMENDWSIKQLIREIVLTRTYTLASTSDPDHLTADPQNQYLWRHSIRRLEAEAIRDAMLAASGDLELERPVGSLVARVGDGLSQQFDAVQTLVQTFGTEERFEAAMAANQRRGNPRQAAQRRIAAEADPFRDLNHRSLYLPIVRTSAPDELEPFDFPDTSLVTGQRDQTTVAPQSLFLLNSPFVLAQADGLARRVVTEAETPQQRVERAFELTLSRSPSSAELTASIDFLRSFPADTPQTPGRRQPAPRVSVWSALCQGLFATAEFQQIQ